MGGNPYEDHVLEAVLKTARANLTLRQIVETIQSRYGLEITREQVRGIIKTLRNQAKRVEGSMRDRLLEVDYRRARRSGHYLDFISKLKVETSKLTEQQAARAEYEKKREQEELDELRKEG